MSDNKKYYYLKLKDSFFDTDEMKILENMNNGYKYSNFLLKLYLKSLKFSGKLRLNEYIPYNPEMIASITNTDIDTVKVALDIFKKLKLIEILEDGTIYMLQIQNFIGESSTEADRVRNYRKQIYQEKKKLITDGVQMYDERTPEIEKEIEKEIEIEIDTEKELEEKISWQIILNSWNNLTDPIKPITKITKKRKGKIKARINSLKISENEIITAILKIKTSDFLHGKNDRGWIIDFDWLFKTDDNFTKVLEGKYDNKGGGNGGHPSGNKGNGKYAGFKAAEPKLSGNITDEGLI